MGGREVSCMKLRGHSWGPFVLTQERVPVVHKGVFMTTETELLVETQTRSCTGCGFTERTQRSFDPWLSKVRP